MKKKTIKQKNYLRVTIVLIALLISGIGIGASILIFS